MDVSIIIINYNTFELTCQCIASIYQHTRDIQYEIIVVDNASTERNPDDFKRIYSGIILVKSPHNVGFAGGNNLGIRQATGQCILLLNSDTQLVDNAIKIAFDKMQTRSQIGALSVRLIFPDGTTQSCANRFPSWHLELLELLRLQKILPGAVRAKLLLGAFFNHQSEMAVDWVWGTFFMFKRIILQALPGNQLPADFFMYGEDMQWCLEIKKLGYQVWYYPQATVVHHLSASTNQANLNKLSLMSQHEYLLLRQHYGHFVTWLTYKLRAIKYLTLSLRNPGYRSYFSLYWRIGN